MNTVWATLLNVGPLPGDGDGLADADGEALADALSDGEALGLRLALPTAAGLSDTPPCAHSPEIPVHVMTPPAEPFCVDIPNEV